METTTIPQHTISRHIDEGATRLIQRGLSGHSKRLSPFLLPGGDIVLPTLIESEREPDVSYRVELNISSETYTCTCPGFVHNGRCKHGTSLCRAHGISLRVEEPHA